MNACAFQPLHRNALHKETIYIGWIKPPDGWIKLNYDGACKQGGELASCGGLFRNSKGDWSKAMSKRLESVMPWFHYKFSGGVHTLVRRIRKLMTLNWHVQFHVTWREDNWCADWFASYSIYKVSLVCSNVEVSSSELHKLLFDDFSGTCMTRNIRLLLCIINLFCSCVWASALFL
jgi:hypothetical protein